MLVTTKILWLKSLLHEFGCKCDHVPVIFCDNDSIQHLAKNSVMHARIKYIEVDFHL